MPAPNYYPPPQPPPPSAGARTHDGFYLRLQLGVSYLRMSAALNGTGETVSGGGSTFHFALGAAVNPHMIVYGTLIEARGRNPGTTFSGQPAGTSAPQGRTFGSLTVGGFGDVGVLGVGGGMAYYLDTNIFFAGSLLASRMFVDDRGGKSVANTAWGFTFEGQVGKEWWVSDNWGLGLSAQLLLGAMKDEPFTNETVATWKLATLGLMFSATYN